MKLDSPLRAHYCRWCSLPNGYHTVSCSQQTKREENARFIPNAPAGTLAGDPLNGAYEAEFVITFNYPMPSEYVQEIKRQFGLLSSNLTREWRTPIFRDEPLRGKCIHCGRFMRVEHLTHSTYIPDSLRCIDQVECAHWNFDEKTGILRRHL